MLYQGKATNSLSQRPDCDFCGLLAAVDGKTVHGPWGYMCYEHHGRWGAGLGVGKGQVLLCDDDLDATLIKHYHLEEKIV
jgi:hypothetical protein